MRKRWQRFWAMLALSVFLILNGFALVGAYALTHTKTDGEFGLGLPRPLNTRTPQELGLAYQTQRISVGRSDSLEIWQIPPVGQPRGTAILFPGNGGSKGKQLLAPARVFHELGYDTWLVDFRGVGGSSGNTITIGWREAEDVSAVVEYVRQQQIQLPLVLYGISMGTAAILRAVAEQQISVNALILELPFTRLLTAVNNRLRAQIKLVPTQPFAYLLVFWGSVLQGVNGFANNPIDFARRVQTPTLVLQGAKDRWIRQAAVQQLVKNLRGQSKLVIFPRAGHDLLVTHDSKLWQQTVWEFLRLNSP